MEITEIKNYARIDKLRLYKDDIRRCAWVCFKRCKLILAENKVIFNMDDEKDFFWGIFNIKKIRFETEILKIL